MFPTLTLTRLVSNLVIHTLKFNVKNSYNKLHSHLCSRKTKEVYIYVVTKPTAMEVYVYVVTKPTAMDGDTNYGVEM